MARRREKGTYDCPLCGGRSPVLLSPGEPCADCRSEDAWSRYRHGGERLVLTREQIEDAAARQEGRVPVRLLAGFALRILPGVLGILAGGASLVAVMILLRPWALGPLDEFQQAITSLGLSLIHI